MEHTTDTTNAATTAPLDHRHTDGPPIQPATCDECFDTVAKMALAGDRVFAEAVAHDGLRFAVVGRIASIGRDGLVIERRNWSTCVRFDRLRRLVRVDAGQ